MKKIYIIFLLIFTVQFVYAQRDQYEYKPEKPVPISKPSVAPKPPAEPVITEPAATPKNEQPTETNTKKEKTKPKEVGVQYEYEDDLHFTFTAERKYNVIHELNGEAFLPARYQREELEAKDLKPGDIKILIGKSTINIEGVEELAGTFFVNTKFDNAIGFIYELMDAKGKPARFKVVTDENKYVTLLYFKSKDLGEHTFYLAEKTEEEYASNLNYYTLKEKFFVRTYGMLVDKKIVPYTFIEDATQSNQALTIDRTKGWNFEFKQNEVNTPQGSYELKKANTYAYTDPSNKSIASLIEMSVKGSNKINKILMYLNYKQQIERIDMGNTQYFLMK